LRRSMQRLNPLHRARIEAAVELLNEVLGGSIRSRSELVAKLIEKYSERGIEPLRGLSKDRIFDKELATLHVIGKYGLAILDSSSFDEIFFIENRCSRLADVIASAGEGEEQRLVEEFRRAVSELKGELEERVFRCLRYIFTAVVLGLMGEPVLAKAIRAAMVAYPQLRDRLTRFASFYAAYRIAEMIAMGLIRRPEQKKIHKYSYCLRMGLQNCAPSDRLIIEVARAVYKVDEKLLARVFASGKEYVPRV